MFIEVLKRVHVDQLGCDMEMMNKEEMLRNAEDPKYISGIYNYCDRWCERCRFTSRCLNHSIVDLQGTRVDA